MGWQRRLGTVLSSLASNKLPLSLLEYFEPKVGAGLPRDSSAMIAVHAEQDRSYISLIPLK